MLIILIFIFSGSLLLNILLIFRFIWVTKSRTRTYFQNFVLSFSAIFYLLLLTEIYFSLFVAKSDAFGFTLANQNWYEKYWEPINSLGYRDSEYTVEDLDNKKVILVTGDSFAAGYGIKDYENRFSNLLEKRFKDTIKVINIAENGYNTKDEYDAIKLHPVTKPDLIILSYFINDIQGAAKETGNNIPVLISPPKNIYSALIYKSHLINYIYWNFYRYKNAVQIGEKYWDYLKHCYSDESILNRHYEELYNIISYTDSIEIPLIVIIFPHLLDIENSKTFTNKVSGFLNQNNVDCIDLSYVLSNRKPEDLIVNNLDPHPNEEVHREVSEILYPKISELFMKDRK